MIRSSIAILAAAVWLLGAGPSAAGTVSGPVEFGSVVALMPVQDRAGDQRTATVLEQYLRFELTRTVRVLPSTQARPVLRHLRIRNVDNLPAERLAELAASLGADWIISVTLHDADRRWTPWLTASARAYRGSDGTLAWCSFEGGTGMDGLGVLGTGVITSMSVLMPRVVSRLTAGLARDPEAKPARGPSPAPPLGKMAVVPFRGDTRRNATVAAEAVTEAARATVYELGVELASPGCTAQVLRRQRRVGWGGVSEETRASLRESCGADSILTGAVEKYDVGGGTEAPEPKIALALRFLDAASGRILWTGSDEREGWDHEGLFELGRVYSQARLTQRMMENLAQRLLKDRTRRTRGQRP